MYILGISAFYHDSAAALVVDGETAAAAQEERFTRKKHDASFPERAVEYCLREAGVGAEDLDLVVFYDKPLLKFDRILETYLALAPRGFSMFRRAMPTWLRDKLHLPRVLDRGLQGRYRGRYAFTTHHESHAASAFFPSPFDEAAILTLDGVGEWATATIGMGRGNELQLLKEMRFPHSLGLLYSAFTYLAGFRVNSGEYKLMGLAPYGEPRYVELILRDLLELRRDGSFRLDMSYFGYGDTDRMTSPKLEALLGPARAPESEISQREMDLAASIQAVTEMIVLRIARFAHQVTGSAHLCLAGGVALNCVANGRLLREGPFERIWVQPAAGDAGGALGAALFAWHQLLEQPREVRGRDRQRASLLGPGFTNAEIREFLDDQGAPYRFIEDEAELASEIARLLDEQNVVAHFAGRMEFGPRALGNRSILGDARSPVMQSTMNRKIKFRESFRPFAPIVLEEDAAEHFEVRPGFESPYMLMVAPVRRYAAADASEGRHGYERLANVRSPLPAITHVDGSARIQTVDPERHPRLHAVLRAFKDRTGVGVLINTSFNVRSEPVVCTPEDAYRCFMATNMDVLVLENCLLLKAEQPENLELDAEEYLAGFPPD